LKKKRFVQRCIAASSLAPASVVAASAVDGDHHSHRRSSLADFVGWQVVQESLVRAGVKYY